MTDDYEELTITATYRVFQKKGLSARTKQFARQYICNKPFPTSINSDQGWSMEVSFSDPTMPEEYREVGYIPEER